MRVRRFAFPAVFAFAAAVGAQTPPPSPPVPPASSSAPGPSAEDAPPVRPWLGPTGDMVVNLPSDETISAGLLQLLVTHRFRDPVRASNAHSWYSIDSGADFGLGLTYAPWRRFELALYRSALQDDYEVSGKLAWKPGGPGSAFGTAIRVGGDDRRDPVTVDSQGLILPDERARTAFFAQAVLALHLWGDRLELSAVPSYASRTSAESRVFNVPVHAAVQLTRSVNIQAEYAPPRRALSGSSAQWTVGVEKTLYHHRFTLVISNTTRTTVDQYLSGDYGLAQIRQLRSFDNGFRRNDWHIGFNLIRQFNAGR